MIGVDTNILVRAFLEDDYEQTKKSQNFLETSSQKERVFISSYTILEFVWVLKTKKYARSEIYDAVITFLDSPRIIVGQREVVLTALEKYLKGRADFGDYMILSEGEQYNCYHLKTFDQDFINESSFISSPD
ncbi:MAG: DNA-binding protein [Alphaproteobacteria bacterium 16-39-46]|nr:MAG: DNA-binding protein [Alphaproteobacteria bacterium 16-39-46]OZA43659.1 MAG: DNA-binding protein [Alphaproteobacteria bacterium 17-39-52]HQS83742.1 type II toxin-antitoxin system VapC family toxin [Alphaproteobacteria bacterium]HQS93499.1 type II toxin-antitoxin system VapC family toxin [Alphaproteobacteria bacterium]